MSAQYTPGPWKFLRHEDGPGEEVYGFDVHAENGKSILYFDADDNPETEANAPLYAAAPDLLEACEAFIDRFDHGARADTDYVAGLMRSAIAKATGASNG